MFLTPDYSPLSLFLNVLLKTNKLVDVQILQHWNRNGPECIFKGEKKTLD